MAKVEGLAQLVAQLQAKAAASKDENVSVSVGYTQDYGLWVHENLEAVHPTGQAKFLEQPARTMQDELRAVIVAERRRGRTQAQALLLAGLRLQRASQLLCPVLTGALRASAFTRLDPSPITPSSQKG